ncbi:MAG: flavin reductase family protein [Candidatus Omnitrophota bacterium]
MKKEIPLSKANRLINSGQVILVSSSYKDKANIITLAWNMPLSHKPALLGISVAKAHLSCELITKSREFVVNIPSVELFKQVIYCGTHSGREVDKFKETGLTPVKANRLIKTPLIGECIGNLECLLGDIKEVGDHNLFIGEAIYAQVENDLFREVWNTEKVKLIYHLGASFFTESGRLLESEQ